MWAWVLARGRLGEGMQRRGQCGLGSWKHLYCYESGNRVWEPCRGRMPNPEVGAVSGGIHRPLRGPYPVFDPVHVLGHPGIDTGFIKPPTAIAPADDAIQVGHAILLTGQGPARVPLRQGCWSEPGAGSAPQQWGNTPPPTPAPPPSPQPRKCPRRVSDVPFGEDSPGAPNTDFLTAWGDR